MPEVLNQVVGFATFALEIYHMILRFTRSGYVTWDTVRTEAVGDYDLVAIRLFCFIL